MPADSEHAPSGCAVDLEPWRAAAAAVGLEPRGDDGRLAFRGRHDGHTLIIDVVPVALGRVEVSVVLRDAGVSDDVIVSPSALALSREGRFLTGDIALDRAVVIQGAQPEVAAPWNAALRAHAARLVGELGVIISGSAARLAPFGAARATSEGRVLDTLRAMSELISGLASRGAIGEQLEAIAASDPLPAVRALYARLVTDAIPTGALGEARAREAIDTIDHTEGDADATFDTLLRAASDSPTAQIREDAIVKLLAMYPLARVEPLLLTTEDSLGARVRDSVIAAIHRAPPPVSPVALLRLMARTPMGPTSLAACVRALGASEDPSAAARLAALCQHPEEPVWTAALTALLRLRLDADAALGWIRQSQREEVWDRLPEIAVAHRPSNSGAVLLAHLAHMDDAPPERRARVIEALGRLGHEPARDALTRLAGDSDAMIAAAARTALASLSHNDG